MIRELFFLVEHHGLVFHGIPFGNHPSHLPASPPPPLPLPPDWFNSLAWKALTKSPPTVVHLLWGSFHSLGSAKPTCPALWTCTENFNPCSAGEFSGKFSRALVFPGPPCSRLNVSALSQVLLQGRNWALLWDLQCPTHSKRMVNSCLGQKWIEPPQFSHAHLNGAPVSRPATVLAACVDGLWGHTWRLTRSLWHSVSNAHCSLDTWLSRSHSSLTHNLTMASWSLLNAFAQAVPSPGTWPPLYQSSDLCWNVTCVEGSSKSTSAHQAPS